MSFIIQETIAPTILEIGKQTAIGAGGELEFYFGEQDQFLFLGDASSNFSLNLTYDASTTLEDALATEDVIGGILRVTQGATPYSLNEITIDGTASGVQYSFADGNLFPLTGSAGTISSFFFEVTKTNTSEFEIFIGQSNQYTDLVEVPGPPIMGSAINGTTGSAAQVFFTPPTFTGSPYAVEYVALSNPSGIIGTGSGSPVTVNGLTTNSSYTFTVKAQTGVGSSPYSSASNSVTVILPPPSTVELLVLAGGAGGSQRVGGRPGAGGGAGGYRTNSSFSISTGTNYTVTVGSGGAGVPAGSAANALAGPGNASVFGTITSAGGGAAGNYDAQPTNGGSGAGGTFGTHPGGLSGSLGNTPATVPSQGNNGGSGFGTSFYGTGGGGGASAVGGNGASTVAGAGGAGTASSITGASVTRGGGGGGSTESGSGSAGAGGIGGGGNGNRDGDGGNGVAELGGGGGASGNTTGKGGNGGAGVVIMAFASDKASPTIGAGLTFTLDTSTRAGFKVYKFTAGSDTISWS